MHGSLPTRLRVLRAERGLTLRDAEHQTGVDKDTLSKIERGVRHPHDVTLAKIAKGYGVPVEDLLEEPVLAGPKAEASETGQLSAAEEAAMIEGLAGAVDAVADRTQKRSEQTDKTDGDALTALL